MPLAKSETALKIDICSTLEQFEALESEWQEFAQTISARSVFLSFTWFRACARCLPSGDSLYVLVLRDSAGKMAGVAPLVQKKTKIRGISVTTIEFLQNPVSPYADFLLADRQQGLETIWHFLKGTNSWDLLRLSGFREGSHELDFLTKHAAKENLTLASEVESRTPYLPLSGTWEEFYQAKSRKFKMTFRSIQNKVQRLENVTVSEVQGMAVLDFGLRQFLDAGAKGWKRLEGKDLLDARSESDFFSEIASVAANEGWITIWLLKQESKVLAGELHVTDGDTVYGLRAHYDGEFAFYSPGRYLDGQIVQRLFERGFSTYDMGPGAAEYKKNWVDLEYRRYRVEIFNRTFNARMLYLYDRRLVPALKRSSLLRRLAAMKRRDPVEK
jgi:CelD/BcsL family acetyltransferase involved in cellulose biosynthesis